MPDVPKDLTCPMPLRSEDQDAPDGYRLSACGETIHLIFEAAYALDDSAFDQPPVKANDAQTSFWKVECLGGHVLLTSDPNDEDADEFTSDHAGDLKEFLKLLGGRW